jgi:hypothetical protein
MCTLMYTKCTRRPHSSRVHSVYANASSDSLLYYAVLNHNINTIHHHIIINMNNINR